MHPSGEQVMLTKQRRLRDEEILVDRDLDILIKLRQGRTKRNVAFIYRISTRHLNDRLHDIPAEVKAAVHRLVDQCTADGLHFVPDAALDSIRRAMTTRNRRVARSLESAQAG